MKRLLATTAVAAFLLAGSASAQTFSGTISGSITGGEAAFTPTGSTFLSANTSSQSAAYATNSSSTPPATKAAIAITGGSCTAVWVHSGGSGVAATAQGDYVVLPGEPALIAINADTRLAAVTVSASCGLQITTGY